MADEAIGRQQLLQTGWQQGSLLSGNFGLTPVAWVIEAKQGFAKATRAAAQRTRTSQSFPFVWERPAKPSDRLVLTTQQCDVIKPPEVFPLVEFALAFETSSAGVLAEAGMLTSARYFLLTPRRADPPGVVLDIRYRCQVDKGVLLEHVPDNAVIEALVVPAPGISPIGSGVDTSVKR